jgi:hypothetical protein
MSKNKTSEKRQNDSRAFALEWGVAGSGHEFFKAFPAHDLEFEGRALGWYLRERRGVGKHYYDPLSRVGLHREFASVKPDRAGILAFASVYGLLGGDVSHAIGTETRAGRFTLTHADSFSVWRKEIKAMEWAVFLYDLLKADPPDPDKLEPYVKRKRTSVHWVDDRGSHSFDDSDPSWGVIKQKNPDGVARVVLQDLVNKHLSGRLSPRLLSDRSSRLKLYQYPHGLVGALWLLMSQEIGGKTTRSCLNCGEWFTPKRSDNLYCSDRCKSNYSYHKGR